MAAGGITAAAVWVDVIPSLKNAAKRLSREARTAGASAGRAYASEMKRTMSDNGIKMKPDVDTDQATKKVLTWREQMRAAIDDLHANVDIDTSKATARILTLSRMQVGTFGIASAIHAVSGLVAALAPAVGVLALLPALGAAAGAGVGVVKLAFQGFGDAIGDDPKKAAEALAKMSPAAREAAAAVNGLKPAWTGLRLDVQQQFWNGLNGYIRDTGRIYIPIARGALAGLAGDINGNVRDAFDTLKESGNVAGIADGLTYVRFGLASASGALAPLTQAFTTLFIDGAPYLARFGGGVLEASRAFSLFIGNASRAGLITVWIDNALATLRMLGQLVGNVGSIFLSVFQASSSSGTNLLAVLVGATGAVATFLNSAKGVALLEGFFRATATALALARPLFSAIGSVLVNTIIPAVTTALPTIGSSLGALAPAVAPLGQLFAALVPLITRVTLVIAQGLASAISTVAPFLAGLATSLAQYPGLATAIIGAFLGFGVAVGPVVKIATHIAGMLPIIKALRTAVSEAGGATKLLGSAFRFLTGPIGIVIALFVMAMAQNEGFRTAVFGLLGAVFGLVGALVSGLMPVFQAVMAVLTPVVGILATALTPVIQVVTGVLNFLAPILSTLVTIVGGVIAALRVWAIVQAAVNLVMSLNPIMIVVLAIGALIAAAVWAYQNLEWFRTAVSAVGDAFVWLWQTILQPVVNFFVSVLGAAVQWVIDHWRILATVLGILTGPIGWVILAFTLFRDQTMAVLTAVGGFFSWLWTSILWPIFSAIGTALAYIGLAIVTVLVTPFVLAWKAIVAIAQWAWTTILQPLWEGLILPFLTRLGQGFTNLYNWYVKPAWDGIVTAIQFAWTLIQVVWALIQYGLTYLGMQFTMLWYNYVIPAWNGIKAAAQAAWAFIDAYVFVPIRAGLTAVGNFFVMLWNNYVVPAWNGIKAAAQAAWAFIQAYVFAPLNAGITAVGQFFVMLWNNYVVPAWNGIKSAAQTAWDFINAYVFTPVKNGVNLVGQAFQATADWIGRAWAAIREAARAPIAFVVNTVYSAGIRPVWNGIAGLFGMAQLPDFRMATGGVLPGYTPGRDVHDFYSPTAGRLSLSGGEGILVPEAVRGLGARFVGWANRYYSGGRSNGGPGTGGARGDGAYASGGILGGRAPVGRRFADGGIVDFFSGAADFITKAFTDPVGAVRDLFAKVIGDSNATPGTGSWTDVLKRIPDRVIDAIVKKVKDWIASMADAGGSGVQRWAGVTTQALAMKRQPASMVGITLRRMNQESGGNPVAVNRNDINWRKGTPSVGLMQVIGPTFAANAGPMRGVGPFMYGTSINPLANIYSSMTYALKRYGSLPAAYNKAGGYAGGGILPRLFDSGGVLPQGPTLAVNNTGGNETVAVFTTSQWASLAELVDLLADLPNHFRTLVDLLREELVRAARDIATRVAAAVTKSTQTSTGTGTTSGTGTGTGTTTKPTTTTPAATKPTSPHPSVAAAKEIAAHMARGGTIFEDFGFRGSSALVGKWNDHIADVFYGQKRKFNTASVRGFLDEYIRRGGVFDNGGVARGMGIMAKQVIRPERVLSPRETEAFEELVPLLSDRSGITRLGDDAPRRRPGDDGAAGAGSGPVIGTVEQHFHGNADEQLATRELWHSARVARRGGKAGAR